MGKSKDMSTKRKQVEDAYQYNAFGVETLLKEWTKVRNEQYYSTNYDLVDVFIDFEYAIRDKSITSDERLVIAALYGLELNFAQVKKLTGMKILDIKKLNIAAIDKIVDVLEVGFDTNNLYQWKAMSNVQTVKEYLEHASKCDYNLFDVNKNVYEDLLYKMADMGEVESKTILGQYEREAEMEWEDQLKDRIYSDKQLDAQAENKTMSDEYLDFAAFQQTKYYSKRSSATQEYVNENQEW